MEFFSTIFIGSLAFVFISAPEKVAGYPFKDLFTASNFRQYLPLNYGNSATFAPAHYQIPPTARPSLYAGTGGIVPSPPPSALYAGTGGIVPSPPPSALYAGTGGIVPSPPPSALYAGTTGTGIVPAPPSSHYDARVIVSPSHYGTGGTVPSPPQSHYESSENELSSYLANQSDDSLEIDFKDGAFVRPDGPRSISGTRSDDAKSPRVSGYVYGYTFKTNKNGEIVKQPIFQPNHGPIIPPNSRLGDAWDDGYMRPRTTRENSFAFDNRLPIRQPHHIIRPDGGRARQWNRRPRPRGRRFEELENDSSY